MTGTLQVLRLKKLLFYGSYKELGTYLALWGHVGGKKAETFHRISPYQIGIPSYLWSNQKYFFGTNFFCCTFSEYLLFSPFKR